MRTICSRLSWRTAVPEYDNCAARVDGPPFLGGRFHGQGEEHRTGGICGADVDDLGSVIEEGVGAAAGPIDELVADHQLARLDVRLQASGGGRREHACLSRS